LKGAGFGAASALAGGTAGFAGGFGTASPGGGAGGGVMTSAGVSGGDPAAGMRTIARQPLQAILALA
jgi:hypothetical protein